jgi:diacylglycerol kinase family enzyme
MTHRAFEARVKWKKNRLKFKAHQMLVVNGRMYGHTAVTPESTLTDGTLTFFARSGASPAGVVGTYLAFLTDTQTELRHTHYFRAKKLTIKTSRKVLVSVDGSALCKTPAKFSVDRNALSVFVGNGFPST